jgi:multidrug efflux pump subunit AcrA (membrane-fusion protein)
MTPPTGFGALLDAPLAQAEGRHFNRRVVWIPLAAASLLLAAWTGIAPLSGAVIAPARIKVEMERKTVQHREGGIVREIKVRNGQAVHAGDVLLMIEDVRGDAELSLLEDQLRAERVRHARASAETTLVRTWDEKVLANDARAAEYLARERAQSTALGSQIESNQESARLAAEELKLNEKLAAEGYVPRARLLPLQRAEADLRGRLGESRSELALARQRAAELQSRMADARNRYQQAATDELKQSSARLRELEERLRPSKDQVDRQAVRSPVDGIVMGMRVAAAGEVLAAGAPIADVVPSHELLVVEARIRPQDISHVFADSPAQVRLAAYDARTTPLLPGRVTFVSPDRMSDAQTGESWFAATVEVDVAALKGHADVQLKAGMPAELFVTTSDRTLFQYLMSPITAFTRRAMRET